MKKAQDTDDEVALSIQIGRRIKIARNAIGMTQKVLAERLGVEGTTILHYEKGGHRITAARLVRIAVALDRTVEYFTDPIEPDARGISSEVVPRDPA